MDNKILIFATSNANKVKEISKMLPENFPYEIKSLKDAGIDVDIPETGNTLRDNAIQKAKFVYDNYGYDTFAEDTGLFIDALNGEPGIYTARYAGEERDSQKNMQKVLEKLQGAEDRKARFITVIALILDGEVYTFEGVCEGNIASGMTGDGGFGYDPVFVPDGYDKTFAQLPLSEKNKISHRANALKKLVAFLSTQVGR